jgi:uncharacterized protein YceK
VWPPPALIVCHVATEAVLTGVGTLRPVEDPLPSSPNQPMPQQYALPCDDSPQVWSSPALMVCHVATEAVLTGVGTLRSVLAPSPSCPYKQYPQQYALPCDDSPQVWPPPALIVCHVATEAVLTGVGTLRSVEDPSPSSPNTALPQQYASPAAWAPSIWIKSVDASVANKVRAPALGLVCNLAVRDMTGLLDTVVLMTCRLERPFSIRPAKCARKDVEFE